MANFTSTLPDDILLKLSEKAKKLSIPKNKIIERALSIYLDQLNKEQYIQSYKQAASAMITSYISLKNEWQII